MFFIDGTNKWVVYHLLFELNFKNVLYMPKPNPSHDTKYIMLKRLYKEIQENKNEHQKQYKKLQKISDKLNVVTSVCDALNVCFIVVSISIFPPIIIGSLVTSFLSGLIRACKSAYRIDEKREMYQRTANQYYELEKELEVTLIKNGLTRNDVEKLIMTIVEKMNVINDSAPPITEIERIQSFEIPNISRENENIKNVEMK